MRSDVVVIFHDNDHEIAEIGEHQAKFYDEMRLLFARASLLGLFAAHND
jgi:hypothetical protein